MTLDPVVIFSNGNMFFNSLCNRYKNGNCRDDIHIAIFNFYDSYLRFNLGWNFKPFAGCGKGFNNNFLRNEKRKTFAPYNASVVYFVDSI